MSAAKASAVEFLSLRWHSRNRRPCFLDGFRPRIYPSESLSDRPTPDAVAHPFPGKAPDHFPCLSGRHRERDTEHRASNLQIVNVQRLYVSILPRARSFFSVTRQSGLEMHLLDSNRRRECHVRVWDLGLAGHAGLNRRELALPRKFEKLLRRDSFVKSGPELAASALF